MKNQYPRQIEFQVLSEAQARVAYNIYSNGIAGLNGTIIEFGPEQGHADYPTLFRITITARLPTEEKKNDIYRRISTMHNQLLANGYSSELDPNIGLMDFLATGLYNLKTISRRA